MFYHDRGHTSLNQSNHFGSDQVRVCLPELANNGPTHLTSADRWNWESDCSVIGIRPNNPGIWIGLCRMTLTRSRTLI